MHIRTHTRVRPLKDAHIHTVLAKLYSPAPSFIIFVLFNISMTSVCVCVCLHECLVALVLCVSTCVLMLVQQHGTHLTKISLKGWLTQK